GDLAGRELQVRDRQLLAARLVDVGERRAVDLNAADVESNRLAALVLSLLGLFLGLFLRLLLVEGLALRFRLWLHQVAEIEAPVFLLDDGRLELGDADAVDDRLTLKQWQHGDRGMRLVDSEELLIAASLR